MNSNAAADFQIFNGRNVLVTGGTGSFGAEFVQRVLKHAAPERVIIFSRDELKQYEMMQRVAGHPKIKCLRFFIGDVRDQQRLEMAFREVDYVVHAAALKQVPTAEYNPFECIHTNVLGAENVVRAALRCGVKRVIALSTDKAASPINLYGASKLASDKIFIAANNLVGKADVRFSVVRYGNVIGSRGSVLPLFLRLVRERAGHLPITDPRMTRFSITLEEGVRFVASCMTDMDGGEVFVPKIPSLKVVDLARAVAPDLPYRVVGIRPGEKLHEVMITEDDARNTVEFPDRYVIQPPIAFWVRNGKSKAEVNGSRPVPENFCYASDTNTQWLGIEELRRTVQQHVVKSNNS